VFCFGKEYSRERDDDEKGMEENPDKKWVDIVKQKDQRGMMMCSIQTHM
jgi:hypothetical protein